MNLCSRAKIKELVEKYNLDLSKSLGQNFLTSAAALDKIIGAAQLKPQDSILEIGPGLGTLTRALAEKVNRVTAVEQDPKLIEVLNETCDLNNVKIIEGDFLKMNLNLDDYKVVSALPYSSAVAMIRKLLEENSPRLLVVTVQKEVAQRIVAPPGEMSVLAVSVQLYGNPEIVSYLSKREFWPQPKVDSAILKINEIVSSDHEFKQAEFQQKFFRVVKAGFAHPRKKLVNSLQLNLKREKAELKRVLNQVGIDPDRRAETLKVKEWIRLSKSFDKLPS